MKTKLHYLRRITCGTSPSMMHHWFNHHHHIWHPWVISFSKIWHMLGLLVNLSLSLSSSLSLSLRLSLSLSYRGHQWIVRVMSFRNMYGYMGLWSIYRAVQLIQIFGAHERTGEQRISEVSCKRTAGWSGLRGMQFTQLSGNWWERGCSSSRRLKQVIQVKPQICTLILGRVLFQRKYLHTRFSHTFLGSKAVFSY